MYVLRTVISGQSTIPVNADRKPIIVEPAPVKCVHNWVDNFHEYTSFPTSSGFYSGYCRHYFYTEWHSPLYPSYQHWVKADVALKIVSGVWRWEGYFEMHSDVRPAYYGPSAGYTVRQSLFRPVTSSADFNPVGPFELGAFILDELPNPDQTVMIKGDSVSLALV